MLVRGVLIGAAGGRRMSMSDCSCLSGRRDVLMPTDRPVGADAVGVARALFGLAASV